MAIKPINDRAMIIFKSKRKKKANILPIRSQQQKFRQSGYRPPPHQKRDQGSPPPDLFSMNTAGDTQIPYYKKFSRH